MRVILITNIFLKYPNFKRFENVFLVKGYGFLIELINIDISQLK